MAEPINLNRARKARAQVDDTLQAARNRVRFGRSKAEREAGASKAALERERLEAHRREGVDD